MYYVYVIQSLKDHKLYVGHTNNLKRRFQDHNSGQGKATKLRAPFRLVYYEGCNILDDAVKERKAAQDRFWKSLLEKKVK